MFEAIRNWFMAIVAFILALFNLGPYAITSHMNYAYGNAAAQKMDIYYPANIGGEANVVLFIHGGAWVAGDKGDYAWGAKETAKKGCVTASMNYRLLDGSKPFSQQPVDFNDMLDDIGDAIAALDKKLRDDGITPKKLAITGMSAGGHLTLLYGYQRCAQSAIPISFLYADVGPSDFTDPAYIDMHDTLAFDSISLLLGKEVKPGDILTDIPELLAVSPIFSVTPDVPPTLLRYGGRDTLVPLSNGTRLDEALTAAGVPHDLFIYENSDHFLLNIANWPGTDYAVNKAYWEKVDEYFAVYMPF